MLSSVAVDTAFDAEAVWTALERHKAVASPEGLSEQNATPLRSGIGCHVCHLLNDSHLTACLRCGAALHRRKPDSLARTIALSVAACVLYLPANVFSVMNITTLGRTGAHTILGGVRDLSKAGLWPLALLVFFASITVPVLKLVGIAIMVFTTRRHSDWALRGRARLYRVIEFVGRWSMIDVFMISILVALVRFGQLATITTDSGAVAFAAVVILTILAAESFDPRLMWDAADQGPTS